MGLAMAHILPTNCFVSHGGSDSLSLSLSLSLALSLSLSGDLSRTFYRVPCTGCEYGRDINVVLARFLFFSSLVLFALQSLGRNSRRAIGRSKRARTTVLSHYWLAVEVARQRFYGFFLCSGRGGKWFVKNACGFGGYQWLILFFSFSYFGKGSHFSCSVKRVCIFVTIYFCLHLFYR